MPTLPRHRPELEVLEDRSLPSVMSYTAPAGSAHDLVLRISGNKLVLDDNGVPVAQGVLRTVDAVEITGAEQGDTLSLDYSFGIFSMPVRFNGGSGPDTIAVSANADFALTNSSLTSSVGSSVTLLGVEKAALTGGVGNNTLDASAFTGSTTLNGAAGNDKLLGGSGVDLMLGGSDNDTLTSDTGGNDTINGGGGDDTYLLDPGSTITVIDDGGDDTVNLSPID